MPRQITFLQGQVQVQCTCDDTVKCCPKLVFLKVKPNTSAFSLQNLGPHQNLLTSGLELQEYHPYVFQIFCQMIELRAKPLPQAYLGLAKPFLTPDLWEKPGNVPALTRLMQAYLSKAAEEIVQMNLLSVSPYQALITTNIPALMLLPNSNKCYCQTSSNHGAICSSWPEDSSVPYCKLCMARFCQKC